MIKDHLIKKNFFYAENNDTPNYKFEWSENLFFFNQVYNKNGKFEISQEIPSQQKGQRG